MKSIGIDPSINSTGICIIEDSKDPIYPIYYIIASSDKYKSQKMRQFISEFKHERLYIEYYEKDYEKTNEKNSTIYNPSKYSQKEIFNTKNALKICYIISNIISIHHPDIAFIEGVSYGSAGHVVDLAGLNYMMRYVLDKSSVPLYVISPTENKKNATGNGNATKDEMIYSWHQCDSIFECIDKRIMTDDLADAYFLANTYAYQH